VNSTAWPPSGWREKAIHHPLTVPVQVMTTSPPRHSIATLESQRLSRILLTSCRRRQSIPQCSTVINKSTGTDVSGPVSNDFNY
jgi:hypothetical protein